jgi:hypothetical protein
VRFGYFETKTGFPATILYAPGVTLTPLTKLGREDGRTLPVIPSGRPEIEPPVTLNVATVDEPVPPPQSPLVDPEDAAGADAPWFDEPPAAAEPCADAEP